MTLKEYLIKYYPHILVSYNKQALDECYVCENKGAFFVNGAKATCNGNRVCKDHLLSITRAEERSKIVYFYLSFGISEANRIAEEQIPDDWVPLWWDNLKE